MTDSNLLDRLDINVDPAAEPVDVDEAVADFLIALAEKEPNK